MIQVLTLLYQSRAINDHVPNISSSNSRSDTSLPTPSPTCTSDSNSDDIHQMKRLLCQPCRIIKRILWATRVSAAKKLASVIDQVVIHNDIPSWCRLLQFPKKCFRMPCRGGKHRNLATLVNNQINEESSAGLPTTQGVRNNSTSSRPLLKWLSDRVSSKLEEGNYKGAVRLACSEDTMADHSDITLSALRLKHPPPHPESNMSNRISTIPYLFQSTLS